MAVRLVVWAGTRHEGNDERPQRGDVVEILSTDQHPGNAVLGNPEWRIIDLPPSVTLNQVESLIASDRYPADGKTVVPKAWFRRQKIDLDALNLAAAVKLGRALRDDDVVQASRAEVMALVVTKPPRPNPQVIR